MSVTQDVQKFQAYLVYLKDLDSLFAVFNYFWNVSFIINVNIMVPSDHCTRIFSYSPFSESSCRQIFIEELPPNCGENQDALNYYPDGTLNMHGCPVITETWNWPPFSIVKDNNITLFEGMILNEFIKVIGATFEVHLVGASDGVDSVKVLTKLSDLMNGEYKITEERNKFFSFGTPHFESSALMFLKRMDIQKSSILILLKPFRLWVWVFLICTVLLSSKMASYLGGTTFSELLFNTNSILLSNSIHRIHTKVRMVMLFWMLFSLILAACYHAIFFETLRSDLHYPLPVKFQEILETNYSRIFIMDHYMRNDIFYFPEIYKANFKFIFTYTDKPPLMDVMNSDEKLIGVSSVTLFNYYSLKLFGNTDTLHRLSDQYLKFYFTIYFSRNSFLLNDYNKMIIRLRSGGLIQKWMLDIVPIKEHGNGTVKRSFVLGLNDVGAAFNVAICLYVIAGLVFAFEILYSRIRGLKAGNKEKASIQKLKRKHFMLLNKK